MIFLRKATDSDLPIIMAWRSNPLLFSGFYTQTTPLSWEEHLKWWQSRNKDWRHFIIVLVEDMIMRDVGVVTVGQLDHWSPEIGYFVGEVSLWGKGVGKKAVSLALDWLKEKGYKYAHTTAPTSNIRSIKLLEGLGFKYLGKAREKEQWMQKSL